MNILFVHQNMPGQYRELAPWLVAHGHKVVFITQRNPPPDIQGVTTVIYKPHRVPAKDAYGLSKVWEEATGAGYGAAMAARKLKDEGFTPDIIIGHAGWGELTFMKEIYPDTPIIGFFEYYYRTHGGPVNFDPESPSNEHTPYLLQARNAVPLMNFEVVDRGHAPTYWQRDRFPERFHDQIYVCHDGIRTDLMQPDPTASLTLGRLEKPITRQDEVLTFMARNLELTRGFHKFMRALPHVMAERPNARVLIIGGNETSYGKKSDHPKGLRGQLEAEVGHLLDWSRIHFLGRVSFRDYQRVVQVSRCHMYLSMPFVLSWSALESMAMQATMVASDVAPVREAMTHGENALLVDYFDHDAIAGQIVEVLARPDDYAHLGPAARKHVVETYDFHTRCLPVHLAEINALVPRAKQIEMP